MAVEEFNYKKQAVSEKRTYSVQEIADILQISRSMASIVKRGKTYSVFYYEGTGEKRQQKWESGLTYSAAKSMKAKIEHEQAQQTTGDESKNRLKEMTISEFLYEFIEQYGYKKWAASTYDGNVGLLENYVHPHIGDKKLLSLTTKMIDDYYDFLEKEAEPAMNMGKPTREHITASTIHELQTLFQTNPDLLIQVIQSVQSANKE